MSLAEGHGSFGPRTGDRRVDEFPLPGASESEGEGADQVVTPKKKGPKRPTDSAEKPSRKRVKKPLEEGVTRKCSDCRKDKAAEDFNQDQGRCKECFNDRRALWRVADTQRCKIKLQKLAQDDPVAFEKLSRDFNKARQNSRKAGSRIKFSITQFVLEWEQKSAVKTGSVGEFMWSGEFRELAATAKFGWMTAEQADKRWEEMEAEEWRPRDNCGPKGFLRLYVRTKDVVESYSETSMKKKLIQQENLKKPTAEQLETRRQLVFSDTGLEEHGADFSDLSLQALSSAAGKDGSSPSGLLAPDVDDLIGAAQLESQKKRKAKGKGRGGKGGEAEDKSDAECESESEPQPEEKDDAAKAKKGKWYDADTKNLKAERDFKRQADSLRESMETVNQQMTAAVTEFRASAADAKAKTW